MFSLFKKLFGASPSQELADALLKSPPAVRLNLQPEKDAAEIQERPAATRGLQREIEALLRAGPERHAATARTYSRFAQWLVLQAPLSTDHGAAVIEALDMMEAHGPDRGDIAMDLREGLELLRSQCHAAGRWKTGLHPDLLDEFPAVEILLVIPDREPPGWRNRWVKAGGRVIGDRCVTMKTSGVLERFNAYGQPFPPYEWGNALDDSEISRDEAEDLGLIRL